MALRIGVLGATADPPHRFHLEIAEREASRFGLDRMLFMVSAWPPHKMGKRGLTPLPDRLAMAEIAVQACPAIEVSRLEADYPDQPSYAIVTAGRIRQRYGEDAKILWFVGSDWAQGLYTWQEFPRLSQQVQFVIVPREGYPNEFPRLPAGDAIQRIDLRGVAGRPREVEGPAFYLVDSLESGISSTLVRSRVAAGQPIDDLVLPGVAEYIYEKGLYRKP